MSRYWSALRRVRQQQGCLLRRVELENQSTRQAVIYHKKLALGESVSVTDRGNELCILARRPRELNARAERRAFSLPGGANGYAAQFTVSIGQGTGCTDVACVIDTTGSNAGKKFRVVVHGAFACSNSCRRQSSVAPLMCRGFA